MNNRDFEIFFDYFQMCSLIEVARKNHISEQEVIEAIHNIEKELGYTVFNIGADIHNMITEPGKKFIKYILATLHLACPHVGTMYHLDEVFDRSYKHTKFH